MMLEIVRASRMMSRIKSHILQYHEHAIYIGLENKHGGKMRKVWESHPVSLGHGCLLRKRLGRKSNHPAAQSLA